MATLPTKSKPAIHPRSHETWRQRHARRVRFARACYPAFANWAALHGIECRLHDADGDWLLGIIYRNKRACWDPAFADLQFIWPKWRTVHCHDCQQLTAILRAAWKLPRLEFEGKP